MIKPWRSWLFLALTALTIALAGCAALADARLSAARDRWQARAQGHYLLRTYEQIRGRRCAQIVEVRDERLVRVVNNTCQHPNLWTVAWLFKHIDSAREGYAACALLDAAGSCICRYDTEVEALYDPVLGYPSQIVTRQIWRADWQSFGYWRAAVLGGGLPACAPPTPDPGMLVVVRELRPLP